MQLPTIQYTYIHTRMISLLMQSVCYSIHTGSLESRQSLKFQSYSIAAQNRYLINAAPVHSFVQRKDVCALRKYVCAWLATLDIQVDYFHIFPFILPKRLTNQFLLLEYLQKLRGSFNQNFQLIRQNSVKYSINSSAFEIKNDKKGYTNSNESLINKTLNKSDFLKVINLYVAMNKWLVNEQERKKKLVKKPWSLEIRFWSST